MSEETASVEPEPDTRSEPVRRIQERFPDMPLETGNASGLETISAPAEQTYDLLLFLRDEPALAFDFLSDITAVDRLHLNQDPRFSIVYQLYSFSSNHRLMVKTAVPEENSAIRSVTDIWPAANWLEREVFDMFGVVFEGHPDLRRLLMPDDYGSHPLRKDYPLHGKGERDTFVF